MEVLCEIQLSYPLANDYQINPLIALSYVLSFRGFKSSSLQILSALSHFSNLFNSVEGYRNEMTSKLQKQPKLLQ